MCGRMARECESRKDNYSLEELEENISAETYREFLNRLWKVKGGFKRLDIKREKGS